MIRRDVPAQWLENPPSFLTSVAADPDLFPEIRDNSMTIYYRGKALIRDLTLCDGEVSGSIHLAYIPQARSDSKYAKVVLRESGFEYVPNVVPLQLGKLDLDTLRHFKAMMTGSGDESDLIHRLICRDRNLVVDQEIAFQDPGEGRFDKIDLCIFDQVLRAFSFVEVKTVIDRRLIPLSEGKEPEVIEQLRRFKNRIEQHGLELIQVFQKVVKMKRLLGIAARLAEIPETIPQAIVSRPALVIGNCSEVQVQEILERKGIWKPLMDALPSVASGLILCGKAGANLHLNASGRQTVVFNPGVVTA